MHGEWGAGKSSVQRLTQDELKANDRVCCIWFNGWTFEGFEDAKTVAIETIVDELKRARLNSAKVKAAAAKVFKRVDWLKVARKAGGFAFTVITGIPTMDQLKGVYNLVTSVVANPSDHVSKDDLKGAAEKIGDFLKEGGDDSEKLPEHIHKFREEFQELLDAADIDQLVVIVDDLDRCLPKTAIETLEAIRLFLFVERTAFVIGADEAMIEYAVREHFPDLPQSSGPSNYVRNYLEKLIQVPFRIPAPGLPVKLGIPQILPAIQTLRTIQISQGREVCQDSAPWITVARPSCSLLEHNSRALPEQEAAARWVGLSPAT
nr:P-loop NTPase fold protein [Pseudomonas fulva]